jgi:GAF domain
LTRAGDDRLVRAAHARFVETGVQHATVRPDVVESWSRSLAAHVDTDGLAAAGGDCGATEHPLLQVMPLIREVLTDPVDSAGCLWAASDERGVLLAVGGNRLALRQGERINAVRGARWDETSAGTNALGLALYLGSSAFVRAGEHFCHAVQTRSCVAAPIRDPRTGELLGALDITGGPTTVSPPTMGMVRAAAKLVETELSRLVAVGRLPSAPRGVLTLRGLGRVECEASLDGRRLRIGKRHSEILVALAAAEHGLTAEQLAIQLYEQDVPPSTVRAELTRLRVLGGDLVGSRPYRLRPAVEADWQGTQRLLDTGRVREAIDAYPGPLLPGSDAPVVARVRRRLHDSLRAAVLACGDGALLRRWTSSPWGADDLPVWQAQAALAPAGTADGAFARGEVLRLDRMLAAPVPMQR